MNKSSIDKLLQNGYPKDDDLMGLPLGKQIVKFQNKYKGKENLLFELKYSDDKFDEVFKYLKTIPEETTDEHTKVSELIKKIFGKNKISDTAEISKVSGNGWNLWKINDKDKTKDKTMSYVMEEENGNLYVYDVTGNRGYEYKGHLSKVVKNMNILLSEKSGIRQSLIKKDNGPRPKEDRGEFDKAYRVIWEGTNGKYSILTKEWKQFLRITALYHDIGKLIVHDRHPLEGWHALKDVYIEESKKLEEIIGERDYPLFRELIRHHDLFGVLTTGEASIPILTSVVGLSANKPGEPIVSFSLLLLLNLADSGGSFELDTRTVGHMIDDWKYVCNTINEVEGNRQKFIKTIIEDAQTPKNAIKRIKRLLVEAAPEKWEEEISNWNVIEEELKYALGFDLQEFCSEFAMISKIDYFLRFLKELEGHCYNKNDVTTKDVICIVIAFLQRLVRSYGTLTENPYGERIIGIEAMGLTRNKEICETLIKAMVNINTRNKGINWATEEVTVWLVGY